MRWWPAHQHITQAIRRPAGAQCCSTTHKACGQACSQGTHMASSSTHGVAVRKVHMRGGAPAPGKGSPEFCGRRHI